MRKVVDSPEAAPALDRAECDHAAAVIESVIDRIGSVFLGNRDAIAAVIRTFVSGGHALIEDVPGVGKTLLATAVARCVGCDFTRLQLTPDLLPSDVVGVTVIDQDTGRFDFRRGPVFTNILLADEINRTTPRTQSALLEAMSERTVSIDGASHELERPFFVLATQNPQDFEGTFPLPENQLDRFQTNISIGYPPRDAEIEILRMRPSESALDRLTPVVDRDEVLNIQSLVSRVTVKPSLLGYIVAFAEATRTDARLRLGLSTRGALALAQEARVGALANGRSYCVPEDIIESVPRVCSHRVIARSGPRHGPAVAGLLEEIRRTVPVPTS